MLNVPKMGYGIQQKTARAGVKENQRSEVRIMPDVERVTTESARVIKVIETKSTRGVGTSANPVRLVTQYWSLDGELLAEKDEFMREKLSQHLSQYNTFR